MENNFLEGFSFVVVDFQEGVESEEQTGKESKDNRGKESKNLEGRVYFGSNSCSADCTNSDIDCPWRLT